MHSDFKLLNFQYMVIQRFQSLILLLSAVVMGIFSFAPLANLTTDNAIQLTAMGMQSEQTIYLFILSLLTTILPAINIFMYKNLSLQKMICWINVLFLTCISIITLAKIYFSEFAFEASPIAFAPISQIILLIVVVKLIKNDENKLKSYDRLR